MAREPFERGERQRWLIALLILSVFAVGLRWSALDVGRMSDDYMQHAMIAGLYPGEAQAPFDLYGFVRADDDLAAHVDKGTVPWFAEPDFRGAMFRPLSSALLWLDHLIAPNQVKLWHGHSLVWLAALIFSFGLCVRRLLPRWPAVLAVVLFACDASFVAPLAWLANRCVLVSASLGFAAIFVHLEWRRPESATPLGLRRAGPVIELILLAASLAAGEYGLGVIAYLFAWELFVGGRDASTPADRWAARAKALIPAVIAVTTYLAIHKLLDYGTSAADVYADPIHSPEVWLKWAKLRIPKLCTGALWSLPASSLTVFQHPGAAWWDARWPAIGIDAIHESHMRLGLVGIALAGLGFGLARAGLHEDERRTLRALLIGGFVGLLPVSVAPADSRLLVIAQLAACVGGSLLVFACVRSIQQRATRLRGLALLPFALAMVLLHTYFDLRWGPRAMARIDDLQRSNAIAFEAGDLLEHELAGRDVIVLNGPSQSVGMYGHFVLHTRGDPVPASWRPLALGGQYPMFGYRSGDQTLELSAIQGAWLRTGGELFFRRADHMLPAGSVLEYPSMRAEVLADQDGRPTQVRFTFPHSLDDPRYLFVTSTAEGINRWAVPPVRGSAIVPLARLPAPGP